MRYQKLFVFGAGLKECLLIFILLTLVSDPAVADRAKGDINKIIIHSIGGWDCQGDSIIWSDAGRDADYWIKYFNNNDLSVHYIIDRSGYVIAQTTEEKIAYHAKKNNSDSIGIELVNQGDGLDPYPEAQLAALEKLIKEIRGRWGPEIGIYAHSEVDTEVIRCADLEMKRRVDPNTNFPMERFRQ